MWVYYYHSIMILINAIVINIIIITSSNITSFIVDIITSSFALIIYSFLIIPSDTLCPYSVWPTVKAST